MRHPSAFQVRRLDAVSGTFDQLRGHKYGLLVTFRRNGDTMPTPVWMAVDLQCRVYLQTGARSGKVKRLSNNSAVLVAASNIRGRPTSSVFLGTARVLPKEEWTHPEATLAAAFGLGRRLYQRTFPMGESVVAYVEVSPAPDLAPSYVSRLSSGRGHLRQKCGGSGSADRELVFSGGRRAPS